MAAAALAAKPAEAVGALAGLQAQHANSPYIALWSRVRDFGILDLETALEERSVVKATVVRATLYAVAATDFHALDAAAAEARIANWTPTAKRTGLDVASLNEALLEYCNEPRTVAEMEAHLDRVAPDCAPREARAGWGTSRRVPHRERGRGLVHVPPSGLWRSHGKPRYIDARVWLSRQPRPDAGLRVAVERYLGAYGPASLADVAKWVGQPRVTKVRAAVEALSDRIIALQGPDGRDLVDLAGSTVRMGELDAPVRFLARWDSALIGYDARDRILPDAHRAAVVKKNGDFLPTFLAGGFVAGLWTVDETRGDAVLRMAPFSTPPASVRRELEAEAEGLIRFVAPQANRHAVAWAPAT